MLSLEHKGIRHTGNRYRWWVLAAALIAQMTAAVSTQGIGVLAGFIQEGLHLSNTEVGALAGVLNAAPIIGLLFVGEWLDRLGERIVIGLGALIMSVAMVCASFTDELTPLLLCLLFVGVGYSSAQPGGSKAVFHWFVAEERGTAMGLRQAGLPLGGVVAAAVYPGVAGIMGWQGAFLIGAFLVAAGGVFFCFVYRKPPSRGISVESTVPSRTNRVIRIFNLLSEPEFRVPAFGGVALVTVQTVALMFLALYYRDHFGLSLAVGATHLLVMQLTGALGRVLLALWSDRSRYSRARTVQVTAAGAALGLLAVGIYPSDWNVHGLFLCSAWLGFFGFGWYGPWVTWISEMSSRDQLGATLGFAMSINQIFIVSSPIFFGLLVDTTSTFVIPGLGLEGLLLTYIVYVSVNSRRR